MDVRGFAGGLCLAIAGIPLAVSYGQHPVGLLGATLVVVGLVFGYGAYRVA